MRTATIKKSTTKSVKPIIKKVTPKKVNAVPTKAKEAQPSQTLIATPSTTQDQPQNQPQAQSKQSQLIALLSSPNGSDIQELMQVTGWQAHSIRGVISGVIRKRLGLAVISEKIDGVHRYRIEAA